MVQMRPGATETQTYKGTIIDGVEEGLRAAQRAAHTFGPGVGQLRAVLTIGVPYAEEVNRSDNHYDYVSPMSEDFVQTVRFAMENMIPKQSIVARTKKHIRS